MIKYYLENIKNLKEFKKKSKWKTYTSNNFYVGWLNLMFEAFDCSILKDDYTLNKFDFQIEIKKNSIPSFYLDSNTFIFGD